MHFGQILLVGFQELHGFKADVAVALAVHHALLERREGLGPGDGGRAAAEGLVGGDQHGALGHAELQVRHVGHLLDGVLGVGDVTEVRVRPAQHAETGLGGVAVEQFGGLAAGADHHFIQIVEEVGQRQDAEALFKGHEIGDAAHGEGLGTFLHIAEDFALVAEAAAEEQLHFDLSFGLFFHVLLEGLGGVTLFGIFRVTHSHAEDLRGGGGGAPEEQSRKHEGNDSFEIHWHAP